MSTEEQREDISGKLSAASTWLEDEGFGATTGVRGLPGHASGMRVTPSDPGVREHEESWGVRLSERVRAGSRIVLPSLQLLCPPPPPSDVEGEAD